MANIESEFSSNDVEILAREPAHEGFLRLENVQLRHRLFAGGWSATMNRELVLREQAVGVLLFDPQRDQLVLVRQFRVGMIGESQSPWLLEIVAGMVGKDEELRDVAIRESHEESNCTPSDLIRICDYYNSPGTTNEKITLYCGRVDAGMAGGIYGLSEEHEDIEVVVLSYHDLVTAVEDGSVNNAMTIVALQWLQLNKAKVLSQWS